MGEIIGLAALREDGFSVIEGAWECTRQERFRGGLGGNELIVNVHRKKAQEAQNDCNAHEIKSFPCQRGEFPQMAGSR